MAKKATVRKEEIKGDLFASMEEKFGKGVIVRASDKIKKEENFFPSYIFKN